MRKKSKKLVKKDLTSLPLCGTFVPHSGNRNRCFALISIEEEAKEVLKKNLKMCSLCS